MLKKVRTKIPGSAPEVNETHPPSKFHEIRSSSFCVILLTNQQTDTSEAEPPWQRLSFCLMLQVNLDSLFDWKWLECCSFIQLQSVQRLNWLTFPVQFIKEPQSEQQIVEYV